MWMSGEGRLGELCAHLLPRQTTFIRVMSSMNACRHYDIIAYASTRSSTSASTRPNDVPMRQRVDASRTTVMPDFSYENLR
jgi:hypothetical protein